jgi:hypothetical protein
MSNGQKIIDFALQFVGKLDNQIFRDWFYGKSGITTADCAVFVSYCYAKNNMPLGNGDYTNGWASVPNMFAHYKNTGEITTNPVAGDIVIMGWDGKTPMHTGLFKAMNADGTTATIEANTSNPAASAASEANGGWTMEKNRPKKFIIAVIHPSILDSNESA